MSKLRLSADNFMRKRIDIMNKNQIQRITINGMLLAVMIVCSQLTIPIPIVPITLQTFAVGLIASLLPVWDGLEVIIVYLLLGTLGFPVFANFSGGLAVFLGPTGGYLLSFLVYQLVTAGLLKKFGRQLPVLLAANCLGALLNLLIGSVWITWVLKISFIKAMLIGFVPFLLPGLLKIIVILPIVKRLAPLTLGRQAG
ncbi:BioY protein [Liquorilactobacillus vini DSM 20605]|uniref:Biotin transporter n=2 Tax=Liquorilactobacillus vini TaxID=238015 RepID=A0A0R2CMI0_9LACO|nr:BioY protein [Liquorilactobacillus vini DSM 20605]